MTIAVRITIPIRIRRATAPATSVRNTSAGITGTSPMREPMSDASVSQPRRCSASVLGSRSSASATAPEWSSTFVTRSAASAVRMASWAQPTTVVTA